MPSVNHCRYVTEWVGVKNKYGLTADEQKLVATKRAVANCGDLTATDAAASSPVATTATATVPAETTTTTTTTEPLSNEGRVCINTAGLEELTRITGVAEIGGLIIAARPFKTLDDLTRVKGGGGKPVEKIIAEGLAAGRGCPVRV